MFPGLGKVSPPPRTSPRSWSLFELGLVLVTLYLTPASSLPLSWQLSELRSWLGNPGPPVLSHLPASCPPETRAGGPCRGPCAEQSPRSPAPPRALVLAGAAVPRPRAVATGLFVLSVQSPPILPTLPA